MVYHLKRQGYQVGRKRVRRLMAKMGLAVIYPKPRTSQPHPGESSVSVSSSRTGGQPARSGVVRGCHLYPDASGLFVPGGEHGLIQPPGFVLEAVQHAGAVLLLRGTRGSAQQVRSPGDLQYGPGESVHQHRVHGTTQRGRGAYLDGRQGPLDGQHLHRASVAFTQIRMRLSERFRNRVGGPSRDRPLDQSIQQRETSLGTRRSDARRGVHWFGQEILRGASPSGSSPLRISLTGGNKNYGVHLRNAAEWSSQWGPPLSGYYCG